MKIVSVDDFIDNLNFYSHQPSVCVVGAILQYNGQLLLLDEGVEPGFYKGNARLILEWDGSATMLKSVLPALGGGPSPFWEAAIVEVGSLAKCDEHHVVVPKSIHYWDNVDEAFVRLVLDETLIQREKIREIEHRKINSEMTIAEEFDPFESAGRKIEKYWSDKM